MFFPGYMSACEMCGKEVPLFKALIEGTELKVCKECASHGKILQRPVFVQKEKKKKKEEPQEEEKETIEMLVEDYSQKVKDTRQRLGLKQEELAKKLKEKESIIQKIETANFKPNLKLAKKLERFLKIKLVQTVELEKVPESELKRPKVQGWVKTEEMKTPQELEEEQRQAFKQRVVTSREEPPTATLKTTRQLPSIPKEGGEEVAVGAEFCPYCGKDLGFIFCPFCGKKLPH